MTSQMALPFLAETRATSCAHRTTTGVPPAPRVPSSSGHGPEGRSEPSPRKPALGLGSAACCLCRITNWETSAQDRYSTRYVSICNVGAPPAFSRTFIINPTDKSSRALTQLQPVTSEGRAEVHQAFFQQLYCLDGRQSEIPPRDLQDCSQDC